MKKKIIIIGSGFGGLAVGCRLAARGHDVEIFEKCDRPGGRAGLFEINGFRFDGGPSIISAPFMIDNIFSAAGRRREDYIEWIPLSPFYRFISPDGRIFDFSNDPELMVTRIERWNPADVDGYLRYQEACRQIFEKSFTGLACRPIFHLADMARVAPDLIRLHANESVDRFVGQFFKDEFLRKVFSFHPLAAGGSPDDAVGDLALFRHLEFEWGICHARGGMGAVVNALVRLLTGLGGKIHYNTEVSEILTRSRRVGGVRLIDGSIHQADVVVSNADAAVTYRSMIDPRTRLWNSNARFEKAKYSRSIFMVYFGTRRCYPNLALSHHNIIFAASGQNPLNGPDGIKNMDRNSPFILNIPSMADSSIAPEGCGSFSVAFPVPNLNTDVEWSCIARPFRDRVMSFLEENYLPGLRENIVAEHFFDPGYLSNTLNNYRGAAFSMRPLPLQSVWFRPHNRSEDFSNLYLVGAGTHPGGGLPGVLNSALIVDKLIEDTR